MKNQASFEKCLAYIGAELDSSRRSPRTRTREKAQPSITISRQTGAGGIPIAENLAAYLQEHAPQAPRPWTVFDKNLVEQVLTDHNLPAEIARYMPEDRISQISDMVEELLGLHPPSWTLLRQTTETILHLAELGNVILVGRGANVITGKLENVFHVRLVGSADERVKLVEDYYRLSRRAAWDFMDKEDRGRKRYPKRYFQKDIDDPLLYHLILNTDRLSLDEATHIIGAAIIDKYP